MEDQHDPIDRVIKNLWRRVFRYGDQDIVGMLFSFGSVASAAAEEFR